MSIDKKKVMWMTAGAVLAAAGLYYKDKFQRLSNPFYTDDGRLQSRKKEEKERKPKPSGIEQKTQNVTINENNIVTKDISEELNRHLKEFLSGDLWLNEETWQKLWLEAEISNTSQWIKEQAIELILLETKYLKEKPAFASGYRRRFIVLAKYAGLGNHEAKLIWKQSIPQVK